MRGTLRDAVRPVIAKILEENKGKPENEIRKALRDGFPWPPRKYHPYKIWLDEIRVQMGKRKFGLKKQKPDPNQANMFDEDPDLFTGGFDY
jgi:hypothetical protein